MAGRPFRRPAVRAGLLVLAVTSMAQGLFVVLFVVFVARVLHGDAAETGLLRGVQAIGAIAGGLLLVMAKRVDAGRLVGLASLCFGLIALATWNGPRLSTAPPLYLALFILVGLPGVGLMTGLITVAQQSTVDGERGRVFAAFGVASALGQAIGMIGAGLLGDRLGVLPLLNTQAALYLLAGVLALVTLAAAGPRRTAAPGPDGPDRPVPAPRRPPAARYPGAPAPADRPD
jgi:MFS family permease